MTDLNETDNNTNNETDSKTNNETDSITTVEGNGEEISTLVTVTDNVADTATDNNATIDADAPAGDENKDSSGDSGNKDESSQDVVYQGEIKVPMDVGDLINGVIAKHHHYIAKYQSEFDTIDPVIGEIMSKLEDAKTSRDGINERVAILKEKRSQLYHQAKNIRSEMYKLMDIDDTLKSASIESKKIRDEIEELDWKIQTTNMSKTKENEIVKRIHELDAKLHTMDSDVSREANVSTKISELKDSIKATMDEANKAHDEITEIADESQKFHEEYVKYNETARGSGGRHKWLAARIASHNDALAYWTERAAGGVAHE